MKIFNTLTRQKDELVPITPGEVKIYACGPTVYNYIHIGNARPLCVFDVLRRYLEWRGYKVNFDDGGLFQYHPAYRSHHDGAYYKISTGKGGTKWYELDGTEKIVRKKKK